MRTPFLIWHVGSKPFKCDITHDVCTYCFRKGTLVALPEPVRKIQPDGTTHVCHPSIGGCNHGFELIEG